MLQPRQWHLTPESVPELRGKCPTGPFRTRPHWSDRLNYPFSVTMGRLYASGPTLPQHRRGRRQTALPGDFTHSSPALPAPTSTRQGRRSLVPLTHAQARSAQPPSNRGRWSGGRTSWSCPEGNPLRNRALRRGSRAPEARARTPVGSGRRSRGGEAWVAFTLGRGGGEKQCGSTDIPRVGVPECGRHPARPHHSEASPIPTRERANHIRPPI